jgi:uncharacterized protein (TIGR02646 family)
MRRVDRLSLTQRSLKYLARRTARVQLELHAHTLDVDKLWRASRQTLPLREVFDKLVAMAGDRKRCMYCGDSEGSDIEHYRPKSRFRTSMYVWNNMLLCCSPCGNLKGSEFPTQQGIPLLLNPSIEDPWYHLDFIPQTGIITARYQPDGSTSLKGATTVRILELDGRQHVAKGCKRTYKHLKRVVQETLDAAAPDALALIAELKEEDDQGLCGWIFSGNGQNEAPFSELRAQYPAIWSAAAAELS